MDWSFAVKVIYLEWIDAVADNGWESHERTEDVHLCKTVGYLIKETKLGLVIASTISEKESNARITIPKAWIRKRKNVKI